MFDLAHFVRGCSETRESLSPAKKATKMEGDPLVVVDNDEEAAPFFGSLEASSPSAPSVRQRKPPPFAREEEFFDYTNLNVRSKAEVVCNAVTQNVVFIAATVAILTFAVVFLSRGTAPAPPPPVTVVDSRLKVVKALEFSGWEDYVSRSEPCRPLALVRSAGSPEKVCEGVTCYDIESVFRQLCSLANRTVGKMACTSTAVWDADPPSEAPMFCACAHVRQVLHDPSLTCVRAYDAFVESRSSKRCKVTDALPIFGNSSDEARVPCVAEFRWGDDKIFYDSKTGNVERRLTELTMKKRIL